MSYMGITAHFLEDAHIRSVLLGLKTLSSSHTAENIRESLRKTINEWNLEGKVNCIVTDNASNMVNAIRLLGVTHLGALPTPSIS